MIVRGCLSLQALHKLGDSASELAATKSALGVSVEETAACRRVSAEQQENIRSLESTLAGRDELVHKLRDTVTDLERQLARSTAQNAALETASEQRRTAMERIQKRN